MKTVVDIEVLEDFSASARCDEGFLRVKRLRCQNRYRNGAVSTRYQVDVVDRPMLDAVAVLIYRRIAGEAPGVEVLTRHTLRPAAYFRKGKTATIPEEEAPLFMEEVVAGLLEEVDRGELGIRQRAAIEVYEEAGIRVSESEIEQLGHPFLPAPGILSEKIFSCSVDVTGKDQEEPEGDGSPLEEGSWTRWTRLEDLLHKCESGHLLDAKTEILLRRFVNVKRGL